MQIRQVAPGLADWARLVTGLQNAFEHAPRARKRSFEAAKSQIDDGRLVWFAAYDGDVPVVDFLLAKTQEGDDGVMNVDVMFGEGFSAISDLVADFFIAYSKHNRCKYLRYGTFNKAVARLYAKQPAFASSTQFYVFEKEIP